MRINLSILIVVSLFLVVSACKHNAPPVIDPVVTPADGNYPPEVANIFLTRCATSGCHNALSYKNAGGLLLDTWDHLFNGGNNGASVVAYSTGNSTLLYFINPNAAVTHDLAAGPTMPYNSTPLTVDEYKTIRNWIAAGAPDKNGNIPFASNPDTRQKTYITQGCGMLAVVDPERNVITRYIPIGTNPGSETPHCVRVSKDGMYAYVCFWGNSRFLQKIDTRTDKVIAQVDLSLNLPADGGPGFSSIAISDDGSKIMVTNMQEDGALVLVDANNMKVDTTLSDHLYVNPHGIVANSSFDTFYATGQIGNFIHRLSMISGDVKKISIDNNAANPAPSRNPHEIMMSPDYSKIFVTCEASNEVRVMDAHTNSIIKVIPVGIKPQEMALSHTKPYLFVTCMEDNSSYQGFKGSVYVFNYNTLELVKRIDGKFYQPHGISVDDKNGRFTVASTNADPFGPASHCPPSCGGGRNGWYNIYDINTLEPADNKRYEMSVYPGAADTRFKQ